MSFTRCGRALPLICALLVWPAACGETVAGSIDAAPVGSVTTALEVTPKQPINQSFDTLGYGQRIRSVADSEVLTTFDAHGLPTSAVGAFAFQASQLDEASALEVGRAWMEALQLDPETLRVDEAYFVTPQRWMLRVHQEEDGVRLARSDVRFIFQQDGRLVAVNGRLGDFPGEPATSGILPGCALNIVDAGLSATPATCTPSAQDQVALTERLEADLAVAPESGLLTWEVRLKEGPPAAIAIFDAVSGVPLESTLDVGYNANAVLKRCDYNQPDDLINCATPFEDTEAIGYTQLSGGNCRWEARYDHSAHPIARIDDLLYGEVNVTAPCGSTPTLTATNSMSASDYRESDMLFFLKQARSFAQSHIHGAVSGHASATLRSRINGTQGTHCPGTLPACYTALSNTITFIGTSPPPVNYRLSFYWHEYGHHVHATYSGLVESCAIGWDEQKKILELFPQLFTQAVAAWWKSGSDYFLQMQELERFSPAGGTKQTYDEDSLCADNFHYDGGNFFEEAFWQAIWDVRCEAINADCNSLSSINAANSFGWSPSDARKHMIAAAVYSLETGTTGPRMMSNFGAMMKDYLLAHVGTQAAGVWDLVLSDHGLDI